MTQTYQMLTAPTDRDAILACELCGAAIPAGPVHNDLDDTWRLRHDRMHAEHAGIYLQVQVLTEQMRAVVESQKADGTDRYVELRRIIKVIGLTEIFAYIGYGPEQVNRTVVWDMYCTVLFDRYGHLQLDGKPLWSKPPTVSDQTKAMIADALRRRQTTEV